MQIKSELISIAKLDTIFSANIELETSKHEFTDISHQNKQGFEDKSSAGRIHCVSTECVPEFGLLGEFESKILTVFLPLFSRLFCLLSSRIFQNNLLDLYLVEIRRYKLSFSAKPATNSFQAGPSFLPDLKKSLREAQNSPGTGTRQMIG